MGRDTEDMAETGEELSDKVRADCNWEAFHVNHCGNCFLSLARFGVFCQKSFGSDLATI